MAVNMAAVVLLLSSVLPYVAPERIESIFKDIVSVVESEHTSGQMKSSITMDDSIPMLAAAAVVESGFREEVERCKLSGDGGRSIGLGQVMRGQNWEGHTKEEICTDRKLQLRLSLHVIDKCWARTPRPDYAFRCYAAGDAAKKSSTATREHHMYMRIKGALSKVHKNKSQKP